ncbi:MAG: NB-ARC domain-containing protein [Lactococcus lactis]
MENFSLSTRLFMFAVVTSIEYDLRAFLSTTPATIAVSSELISKSNDRNKEEKVNEKSDIGVILNGLDLGDLVGLINSNGAILKLSNNTRNKINSILVEKLVPIRNRIMHSKPLYFSDRGTIEEAMRTLDKEFDFINWNELLKTKDKIYNNPEKLMASLKFIPEIEDTSIYHNLPEPEFDDTGYIGRKQELHDLDKLINSDIYPVVTIVGNGGFGKTALVVKYLYDFIDSNNSNKFDAIVWTTLKTKTLSRGEFIKIKDCISNATEFFNDLQINLIQQTQNPVDDIISFMENFPTLLVIDNLETMPTLQVIEFLKRIPSKSKVLITSRKGLGELENRYELKELSSKDSIEYFRLLSKYFQLELHQRSDEELQNFIVKNLYSSPLVIKWYLTGIFYGADSNSILANKKEVIEFCMSNIIDKLAEKEVKVLWLLLNEGKPLTFGEIVYYIGEEDYYTLVDSVNKLKSTSMLSLDKSGIKYSINSLAKDYLTYFRPVSNEFIDMIRDKRMKLHKILETISSKNENDPFDAKSIQHNLDNPSNKIASYYLTEALEKSYQKDWTEASHFLERALTVAPEYFEIYKIRAFITSEMSNYSEAQEFYRIALENAPDDTTSAVLNYHLSVFYTVKMQEHIKALEYIEKADELFPNNLRIQLEKGRILTNLSKYKEAIEIFERIKLNNETTIKFANQYISKYLDVYLRRAQSLNFRDYSLKLSFLGDGLEKLDYLNEVDYKTSTILIKVLTEVVKLSNKDKEKSTLLFEKYFIKYKKEILKNNTGHLLTLKRVVRESEIKVEPDIFSSLNDIQKKNKKSYSKFTVENEGIITQLFESSGFIKNKFGKYYFDLEDFEYASPMIDDEVTFKIHINEKGKQAKEIDLIF